MLNSEQSITSKLSNYDKEYSLWDLSMGSAQYNAGHWDWKRSSKLLKMVQYYHFSILVLVNL